MQAGNHVRVVPLQDAEREVDPGRDVVELEFVQHDERRAQVDYGA